MARGSRSDTTAIVGALRVRLAARRAPGPDAPQPVKAGWALLAQMTDKDTVAFGNLPDLMRAEAAAKAAYRELLQAAAGGDDARTNELVEQIAEHVGRYRQIAQTPYSA